MTDVAVRVLGEDDWETYRAVRLRALKESPEFFVNAYDDEAEKDEEFWRARMRRSRRLVAERGGEIVGVVCTGHRLSDLPVGELFGLWVQPSDRGSGVAWKLVDAATRQARSEDWAQILYWVSTDNPRGIAFASSFGFRPTDLRREMRLRSVEEDAEEIALVYPLRSDVKISISPADLD